MLDFKVKTNLPDFKRQLAGFSADFEKRVVRSAAGAAATVFKKLAVRFAPVMRGIDRRKKNPRISGTLRKAIYSGRSRRRSGPGVEAVTVSFRQGKKFQASGQDAFYGRFLEAGWTPRGPGRKLKGGKRSRALQRSRNTAAGAQKITKYRFLAPAFAAGQGAALAAFEKRIAVRIAKENAKR